MVKNAVLQNQMPYRSGSCAYYFSPVTELYQSKIVRVPASILLPQ